MRIKILIILSSILALLVLYGTSDYNLKSFNFKQVTKKDPPCLQMHYYIEKYADEYDIPLSYAFGLAYEETGYRGPFHWKYNHKQTSSVGAVGPMQIMPATAEWMEKEDVNVKKLREDIEYNVRISMKLLRYLHNKYGDWKLVFGCYNTGRPCINEYANDIYNKNFIWDK
jgi:soluble lytic murein transglycosylase-like protein